MPTYSAKTLPLIEFCQNESESGRDVYQYTPVKCRHRLQDVIARQKTVRVSNLLTLGCVSDMQTLVLQDSATCFVVLWRGMSILMCGNHRFWWLFRSGYQDAWFWTMPIAHSDKALE